MSHNRAVRATKKQVVVALRQEEILEAGRRVFASRGFEGASVDEIARAAGVAKGTVYLYYSSKRALYRAALRQGLELLMKELRDRVGAARTVREKVRAYVETKVDFIERHRDFLCIYSAASAGAGVPLYVQKDFEGFYREQVAILEAALASGRARSERRAAAALGVFDLTTGIVKRRLHGGSAEAARREVEAVLGFAWKGIAGR
jgi:AcrR family transcriptional regulator